MRAHLLECGSTVRRIAEAGPVERIDFAISLSTNCSRRRVRTATASSLREFQVLESLEPRLPLAAQLVITELMARNSDTLRDGHGEASDWIEIQNLGDTAVDLGGYYLTDDANLLTRWRFPATHLAAGEFWSYLPAAAVSRTPPVICTRTFGSAATASMRPWCLPTARRL